MDAENDSLGPIAIAIGEAWARQLVRGLRAVDREVLGGWPGTISEARMRILARVQVKLDIEVLDGLARVAISAARRQWHEISQPDPEP